MPMCMVDHLTYLLNYWIKLLLNYISDLRDTVVEGREFHSLWWRRNWFQMFIECLPEDLVLYWIE